MRFRQGERLRKARGRVRKAGADYLAYALIDAVVDAYFPVVDDYGERIEILDEQLSAGNPAHFMDALHDVRSDLMTLRRAIRPLRDSLVLLMPDPHSLVSDETQFHLRDCYDHTIQLMDLLDTYREMCADGFAAVVFCGVAVFVVTSRCPLCLEQSSFGYPEAVLQEYYTCVV